MGKRGRGGKGMELGAHMGKWSGLKRGGGGGRYMGRQQVFSRWMRGEREWGNTPLIKWGHEGWGKR